MAARAPLVDRLFQPFTLANQAAAFCEPAGSHLALDQVARAPARAKPLPIKPLLFASPPACTWRLIKLQELPHELTLANQAALMAILPTARDRYVSVSSNAIGAYLTVARFWSIVLPIIIYFTHNLSSL
jgi:hypothetical protein